MNLLHIVEPDIYYYTLLWSSLKFFFINLVCYFTSIGVLRIMILK